MARIPKKVKDYIAETFGVYKENEALELFDIFHLYDTGKYGISKNDGYHDAKHFDLVGYNTKSKEFRKLGRHDAIQLTKAPVDHIRIFADGSTLIKFEIPSAFIHNTQKVYYVYPKAN